MTFQDEYNKAEDRSKSLTTTILKFFQNRIFCRYIAPQNLETFNFSKRNPSIGASKHRSSKIKFNQIMDH